jgi:iron complex transport system substrate-binding protein
VGIGSGELARAVTPAELAGLRPDVVLVKPCGFSLARALDERQPIERALAGPLAAGARVYISDGNAHFIRPGPRLVESLEILAACVHPDAYPDFAQTHADAIQRVRGT